MTSQSKSPEELKRQIVVALAWLSLLSGTIRAAGSIPSGHLYAMVMNRMSLESYQRLIQKLVDLGFVAESNHLLTWIGENMPRNIQAN